MLPVASLTVSLTAKYKHIYKLARVRSSLFSPGVNGHCENCNTEPCAKAGALDFTKIEHGPTGTYTAGGILEVETIITAHHKGCEWRHRVVTLLYVNVK